MAHRLCTSVRPYKKGQSPIFGYFLPGTSTGMLHGLELSFFGNPLIMACGPLDFLMQWSWSVSNRVCKFPALTISISEENKPSSPISAPPRPHQARLFGETFEGVLFSRVFVLTCNFLPVAGLPLVAVLHRGKGVPRGTRVLVGCGANFAGP